MITERDKETILQCAKKYNVSYLILFGSSIKEDKEARKVAETAEMAHLNEDNDPPEKSSEEVKSEDTCRHCKKQLGPRSFRTIISNKGNIEHIGFCVDCFETGELK